MLFSGVIGVRLVNCNEKGWKKLMRVLLVPLRIGMKYVLDWLIILYTVLSGADVQSDFDGQVTRKKSSQVECDLFHVLY